jgi:hypothetical protein
MAVGDEIMWKSPLGRLILAAVLFGLTIPGCIPAKRPAKEAGVVAQKGLVGYWRLDEGSGVVAKDRSGHGRDGEIHNAEWVSGGFGTALHFNGENTCVVIPEISGLNGSEELTVEAWVLWEGTGRYPNIFTGGAWNPGGFMIFVGDNQCSFRMGKPGPTPWQIGKDWEETGAALIRPIQLGRWYHLAASFKRPILTTYVDGELAGSASWNHSVGHSGKVYVGTWNESGLGSSMFHYGMISEVKILNRALSRSEIEVDRRKEAGRRK